MDNYLLKGLIGLLCLYNTAAAQTFAFSTRYARIRINNQGYITSISDKASGREYNPSGDSSALLSLYKDKSAMGPVSATLDPAGQLLSLSYPNGAVAKLKIEQKRSYLRLQLVSLTPRNGVDNIVWGPYKTTISQMIGEIVSVVRDDRFSIGMQALDERTTSGPPTDGDLYQSYYLIHAPPGVKLPANLHEGQVFNIGGDSLGSSDVAFFSQPAEYFRYIIGNGAALAPYGSNIVLHARDRRIAQTINFRPFTMSPDRHQYVAPIDVDFVGSSIALFGCPEPATLPVIEEIELGEGLPHPVIDGKWVKNPMAAKPFLAWRGVHDSAVSYARQLGFEAIQDEGMGEYYYNPANRWDNKKINFSEHSMSIGEYTRLTNKAGIAYGLHTLCEFIQRGSADVTPVPNDSLCRVGSTVLLKAINPSDTILEVADPVYLRESGGWENIYTNVLKVGKELIGYGGVTSSPPYTLLQVVRGWDHTVSASHAANDSVHKLMPNAYAGFAPDMFLQDKYAKDYAKLLNDGGMDYIDFDGLESCWYQGHGQYSIKRFYDTLFRHLDHYTRNTGSCIFEGNWHYMSSLDVGGNLFDPAANTFKIQGKDFKYIYTENLLHFSFGLVDFSPGWNAATAENLEVKAIGWDGQYMLGLSQKQVEQCGAKGGIFRAIRTWEEARAANVFTAAHKRKFRVLENKFHLEPSGSKKWKLFPVEERNAVVARNATSAGKTTNTGRTISSGKTISAEKAVGIGETGLFTDSVAISNPFHAQPVRLIIRVDSAIGASLSGLSLQINRGKIIKLDAVVGKGYYIVWEEGRIYATDEHWNPLTKGGLPGKVLLQAGDNVITVRGDVSSKAAMSVKTPGNIHFTASFLGAPELLGK